MACDGVRDTPICRDVPRRFYRGTWLIRKSAPLGPYSRNYAQGPTVVLGRVLFLMSEVSL